MISAGVAFCPGVLSVAQLMPWVTRIDEQYERIEAARKLGAGVSAVIPPGQRFAPTASSFTIGTIFPGDLSNERVRTRFACEEFYRPAMEAGDAVLMRGDILHRTLVTPEMTQDRTSIELRFFEAKNLPVRFKGDRFVVLCRERGGL